MGDISIHETDSGSFNVLGMKDGAFFLQGNLTKDQLYDLLAELDNLLMKKED